MKNILKSKINWVGIITVLIGSLTALQQLELSKETMGYVMVTIGILTTILRTFFSSPIVDKNVDTTN